MFENNIWLSGVATEDIQNHTICIYNPNDQSIRNIKHRDEMATNVFVYVDQVCQDVKSPYAYEPLIIEKDKYVRCLRINISVV